MLVPRHTILSRQTWRAITAAPFASPISSYGRTATFRRSLTQDYKLQIPHMIIPPVSSQILPRHLRLAPHLEVSSLLRLTSPSSRAFHSHSAVHEQSKKPDDIRDPPRTENESSSESGDKAGEESKSNGGQAGKEQSKDNKEEAPPPPHGDKSPWQVFTETLRSEFKSSKEWNESTKALASSAHQFTESESVRKAREAYSKASGAATSRTSEAVKGAAKVVGQGAAWTWETPVVQGIRSGVNATGRGIEKATRPVRQTKAFKDVKEAIDDGSSSRYGGWVEKEERRKQKELRDLKDLKAGRRVEKMDEDPNAGTNVTLHKDAAWKESWSAFRDDSKLMQSLFSLKSTYNESENPLISTARSITDRFAGFFAENETAMVIKKFREMDPNFQIDPFMRDMREYILPEVLDAYVKGDTETLKLWLSAAQFQVYSALSDQYTKAGLKSDGRILDIRHVDILNARMLEPGDIPVFIITCRTQEVHVYRNLKSGELAAGMEDRVQLVTYAIGVTRIPEDVNNPETRGWRLIELQKAGRDYI